MKDKNFKEYLSELQEEEKNFSTTKDNQSYVYIYQLADLLYNELSNLVLDKKILHASVYSLFRKNIEKVFFNVKNYTARVKKEHEKDINELLRLCFSNNYIDMSNLNNIYKKFKEKISESLSIDEKINTLVESNFDIFKGDLYSKTALINKQLATSTIENYKNLYINELKNNVSFKKANVLNIYKSFIDNVINDIYEEKRKIRNKNLLIISNVSYDYLKKEENSNVDKYTKANKVLITNFFTKFEKYVKDKKIASLKIKKTNKCENYLLDFNTTMNGMIKNVFEEMNDIVSLNNDGIRNKLKDFNELITHIFEINLIFDKQFIDYKNSFLIKNINKFNDVYDEGIQKLVSDMKENIFNIFRENIKIYNDIIYKAMLLKSKADTYDEVLSISKVKDLLLK